MLMDTNFLKGLKAFNLFRLLESETLEMFSMQERHILHMREMSGVTSWYVFGKNLSYILPTLPS